MDSLYLSAEGMLFFRFHIGENAKRQLNWPLNEAAMRQRALHSRMSRRAP